MLPGRLPVLDVGLEFDLEPPPGVEDSLYEGLRGVLNTELSLSDKESGVPAECADLVVLGKLPIGTDLAERSRTYIANTFFGHFCSISRQMFQLHQAPNLKDYDFANT